MSITSLPVVTPTTSNRRVPLEQLHTHFPTSAKIRKPWEAQEQMMAHIAKYGSCLIESGTGTGKTAVELAAAQAISLHGRVFLVFPNKTILEQVVKEYPGYTVAFGRNEHPCLYYTEQELTADQVPCSILRKCPHRVDQKTGETFEPGAVPCPYLQQKYEAKQQPIVLCTLMFYLYSAVFAGEFEDVEGLIIDEVHRVADIIRQALSFEISDYYVSVMIDVLNRAGATEAAGVFEHFLSVMKQIVSKKAKNTKVLLSTDEIKNLIDALGHSNEGIILNAVQDGLRSGALHAIRDVKLLKHTETIARGLRRYIRALGYSLPTDDRGPLNYCCAYFEPVLLDDNSKRHHVITVRGHYAPPMIKRIMRNTTIGFSATIGDAKGFEYETGIRLPIISIPSPFQAHRSRLYIPTDTPDLAVNARGSKDLGKSISKIIETAIRFRDAGHRSLFVVGSNLEKDKAIAAAERLGINAITYGNGISAKQAAHDFREGQGDMLIGTAANYAEGVDLPGGIAPITFFLRPLYPPKDDPMTQFEEQRYGRARWAVWNNRAMKQVQQVRGRNIRGHRDKGVTFLWSQQFRRIALASMPKHLTSSYKSNLTLDQCIDDTLKLLSETQE